MKLENNQPILCSWNTTQECNLKCVHCYRDAGDKKYNELTTEEGKSLLDEIKKAGFKIIVFSGGEPLLRKDIFELTEYASSIGLRPVFGTNGTLIDREMALRLKASGAARISISLDSLNESQHDKFRGVEGSWSRAVKAMKILKEIGLSFQINTTVTKRNIDEVLEITDFAVEIGADAHHIFFLVPTGRAVDIEIESLNAFDYEDLLKKILLKSKTVNIELKPTCAPQYMRIAKVLGIKTRFTKGCLAGTGYCSITPEGDVWPCPYMPIKVGNVRVEKFSEIWRDAPLFKELREGNLKGSCGKCSFNDICGGCRARALFYNGDYLGEEPWCLMRKQ